MAFGLLKSFINPEYLPLLKYANPRNLKVLPLSKLVQFAKKIKTTHDEQLLNGKIITSSDKRRSLLEIYFYQIHSMTTWCIELSMDHLSEHSPQRILWKPTGFFFTPSENFRNGLKWVYEGYYEGKIELFDQGLKSMSLYHSKDIMMAHFGSDGGKNIVFDPKTLSHTIDLLTQRALETKTELDENFLAFGIMLLTLYESLGQTKDLWDVKKVYLDSRKLNLE